MILQWEKEDAKLVVNVDSVNISDNDKRTLEFLMCFSEERDMYFQFDWIIKVLT